MLTRSIDESPNRQLRHHPNKPHDYMSKSHDHGSLASYRAPKSQDRGPRSLTSSLNKGPMSLSKSQDRGLMSKSQDRGLMSKSQDRGLMSKSQDRGLMSKSQDRGSVSGYASARKVTVPAYGFDGRRLSTGSRDVTATHRMSDIRAHYGASQQLQMGRSVDSTVSLSPSSQRQSFRDTNRLQFSDPVGYRSGDATPDETSPLDARAPASGLRTRHRQLKSPDFFDVKKAAGDAGGIITAVSRMHHDPDPPGPNPRKQQNQHSTRRDILAGSARNDTASSHSSEISYKPEKELSGAQELLEIGSWNEDDEEYLRIYKGERTEFVDILEDTKSPGKPKNWAEFSRISEVGEYHGQYDNALYEKSEPESDLSEPASPPRAPPATKSRISSTSATSIDLNRSTDTTCSTHSQYDNAFWSDPPSNPTFRPWNPKHESAMTPAVAPAQSHDPAAEDARMLRYNDGLERLTSYMKTASLKSKRGVSDDMSSSQASGCFDYLVDFLETQQSITDVLVSAHGSMTPKRLDAANDAASMLSSRSVESRVTDLGSEASWESGKSRSVQTLGASGKVMDQITEKVDSLSFDSPKHLSTFKFGLKKTTVGAFETITSSDQDSVSENWAPSSQTPSRTPSQRTYPGTHFFGFSLQNLQMI
jgi:hypothetical protein